MDAKERLAGAVFDSFDAMMLAYADEAVRTAAAKGERLDFTEASIAGVERCLATTADVAGQLASDNLEHETRVWGAYLGEVVRRRFGGEWQMSQYPGGALAVPTLEVRGSNLYPMMKVYRRLTMGSQENLTEFYAMIAKRLGPPASIH
jgi:hypothetical protein